MSGLAVVAPIHQIDEAERTQDGLAIRERNDWGVPSVHSIRFVREERDNYLSILACEFSTTAKQVKVARMANIK